MKCLILGFLCAFGIGQQTIDRASQDAKYLQMTFKDGSEVSCSGTAISSRSILTATHCLTDLTKLTVDKNQVEVIKIISDGADHSIVILSKDTFKSWSRFSLDKRMGTPIFYVGNPSVFVKQLRIGYISGFDNLDDENKGQAWTYDINGYPGDSGSGIFNENGKIVGVISYVRAVNQSVIIYKVMGGWDFKFTEEQICEGVFQNQISENCKLKAGL